ncbi:hypothetical protein FQN54_008513 [Arachnomyces sp. PD_36]|nr:hypothetical protein FQN54_008513 [Arachnomyces sp. PD_36]
MASKSAQGAPQRATRMSIDALLNPSGADQRTSVIHCPHENHYQPYPHPHQYRYHPQDDEHYRDQQYRQQYHDQYRHGRPSSEEDHLGSSRHRSESTHSSPGPYSRSHRFPSVSSGSSTVPERRRPPRPKYDEEEMYFIWYHRVDLRQEWKEVRESFNAQFPTRQRSGFQGIQCKYYRFIKENKCPTLREQRRQREGGSGPGVSPTSLGSGGSNGLSDSSPAYGVVQWTGRWYPWMREPPPPMRRL